MRCCSNPILSPLANGVKRDLGASDVAILSSSCLHQRSQRRLCTLAAVVSDHRSGASVRAVPSAHVAVSRTASVCRESGDHYGRRSQGEHGGISVGVSQFRKRATWKTDRVPGGHDRVVRIGDDAFRTSRGGGDRAGRRDCSLRTLHASTIDHLFFMAASGSVSAVPSLVGTVGLRPAGSTSRVGLWSLR